MLKAWTHHASPYPTPYWTGRGVSILCVEYLDGHLEWRRADTGEVFTQIGKPDQGHKEKLLPREHWPAWFSEHDDFGMDVGL